MTVDRRVSVVIVARDEERLLPDTLRCAQRGDPAEIIVVDGDSRDATRAVAERHGVRVVRARPGRGCQLNAGAAVAAGDTLVFVHADTRLPPNYVEQIDAVLRQPGVVGGAFPLRIDGRGSGLRVIERCASWRARWLRLPYGDQALFVGAETFAQVGGFPNLPMMEDLAFVQRLRRRGRIALARAPVWTSDRLWAERGVWRTTLVNQACVVAFACGASPRRLAGWRRRGRLTPAG